MTRKRDCHLPCELNGVTSSSKCRVSDGSHRRSKSCRKGIRMAGKISSAPLDEAFIISFSNTVACGSRSIWIHWISTLAIEELYKAYSGAWNRKSWGYTLAGAQRKVPIIFFRSSIRFPLTEAERRSSRPRAERKLIPKPPSLACCCKIGVNLRNCQLSDHEMVRSRASYTLSTKCGNHFESWASPAASSRPSNLCCEEYPRTFRSAQS